MAGLEKNIWNNIPEEWGSGPETDKKQTEDKIEKQTEDGIKDNTGEKPLKEESEPKENPPDHDKNHDKNHGKNREKTERKTKKSSENRKMKKTVKEYRELLDKNKKERENADIYERVGRKDRHDFLILGIGLAVIIGVIALACLKVSDGQNQRVYSMIDSGSYATAYQELIERYEKGKNVDDPVIYFVESCVENSEYKRAVAALELLSDQAGSKEDFFFNLAKSLIAHEKENRLDDVFQFMYNRGGSFAQCADQLATKLADE